MIFARYIRLREKKWHRNWSKSNLKRPKIFGNGWGELKNCEKNLNFVIFEKLTAADILPFFYKLF